ncbi:hypothetical protein ACIBKX_35780 [Streptomyces sp. NPDC050658]|uniref:hypothetical protein n=1 Tax=unclassified Streptomyces TaxID=2593676 RepID=UPI00343BEF0C
MPGIDECLLEAMTLPGARGVAIVDWTSGLSLGAVGDSPNGDHEVTAAESAEVARAAVEYRAFAPADGPPGEGPPGEEPSGDGAPGEEPASDRLPVEDLIVTTRTSFHLIRFVATTFDSSVFLHLWLDRDNGNLALARRRLSDLAERLVLL